MQISDGSHSVYEGRQGGKDVTWSGTFPLSASLINVSGSVIEHSEHGNDSVGRAVGASNV